tara:strand:+ start:423 stop:1907 length:1485 start_codon:yes stop_codon:yes gene_type:complete
MGTTRRAEVASGYLSVGVDVPRRMDDAALRSALLAWRKSETSGVLATSGSSVTRVLDTWENQNNYIQGVIYTLTAMPRNTPYADVLHKYAAVFDEMSKTNYYNNVKTLNAIVLQTLLVRLRKLKPIGSASEDAMYKAFEDTYKELKQIIQPKLIERLLGRVTLSQHNTCILEFLSCALAALMIATDATTRFAYIQRAASGDDDVAAAAGAAAVNASGVNASAVNASTALFNRSFDSSLRIKETTRATFISASVATAALHFMQSRGPARAAALAGAGATAVGKFLAAKASEAYATYGPTIGTKAAGAAGAVRSFIVDKVVTPVMGQLGDEAVKQTSARITCQPVPEFMYKRCVKTVHFVKSELCETVLKLANMFASMIYCLNKIGRAIWNHQQFIRLMLQATFAGVAQLQYQNEDNVNVISIWMAVHTATVLQMLSSSFLAQKRQSRTQLLEKVYTDTQPDVRAAYDGVLHKHGWHNMPHAQRVDLLQSMVNNSM